MKNRNKIYLIATIILVVLFVFWFSFNGRDKSILNLDLEPGWARASSPRFKYSIELPDNWYVHGSLIKLNDGYFIATIANIPTGQNFSGKGNIFVNVTFEENINIGLEEWFLNNGQFPRKQIAGNYYYENITIDSLPSIVQYAEYYRPTIGGETKDSKAYYIKTRGGILKFKAFTPSGENTEELFSIFDRMMATLVFFD